MDSFCGARRAPRVNRARAALPLLTLCALPGVAAPALERVDTLEEVIVSARRVLAPALGAAVVDEAEVARRRARTSDTASLLRGLPGLGVYGAGGVSGLPAIRGLADDRLRTLVDGVDLVASCPNHMNSPLSYIDPTAVRDIDVYAGVTPVSVGGDSIGGTIAVRSADPAFASGDEPRIEGEAGTFFRSAGDGWGGNIAAAYATSTLSLAYAGSYAQAGNYVAGSDFRDYTFTGRPGHSLPRDEVGSTAYETSNQSLEFAWQRDGHLVDVTVGWQDIPSENYPNQRMDMTENESRQLNLAYTGRLSWGTLRVRAFHQYTRHAMDFGADKRYWYGPGQPPSGSGGDTALDGTPCSPISGTAVVNGKPVGCAAGMPMRTDGTLSGLTLGTAIPVSDASIVRVGAEYHRQRLDDWWSPSGAGMWPYTFLNLNDGERDRYATYAEWERESGKWTHTVGARMEAVRTDAGPVHGYNLDTYPTTGTGGLGNQTRDAALFNTTRRARTDDNWDLSWLARYEADPNGSLELGIARKTRSPNLYERFAWSTWQMPALMNNFAGDGNGYVGNLALEPEVAYAASVSGSWHDAAAENWRLEITPYCTVVSDYVDAVQWDGARNAPRATRVVDNFTVLRFQNADARLYGVDVGASWRSRTVGRFGQFTAALVASYARGENTDTDVGLYNVMPPNATLSLTQESGRWRNTLEGEFVDAKTEVSTARNEMRTAGYGLVHLRSRYDRDQWSTEIGVENLLDRGYDLPLGGAYVGQGTTMTIPPSPNEPQWGTPVPGTGRSLYAGLTLRF